MGLKPFVNLVIALTVAAWCFLPIQARACLPGPVGLRALIESAEQAVYVEIVSIEPPQDQHLLVTGRALRKWTIRAVEAVSYDLALGFDELLPKIPRPGMAPSHVEVKVFETLDPKGPTVRSTMRWPLDFNRSVIPGQRAVIFLHANSVFPGLKPLNFTDAISVLPDHLNTAELLEVIRAGFASKRAGWRSDEIWLKSAVRSPNTRIFLQPFNVTLRLHPDDIIDALAREPDGTYNDIVFLQLLRDVPSPELDHIALGLTECWLASSSIQGAYDAMKLALERWQLPGRERLEPLPRHQVEMSALHGLWQEITDGRILPDVSYYRSCKQRLGQWIEWEEEIRAAAREARK